MRVSQKAQQDGSTLRDAALALGHVTAEQFAAWVDAKSMTTPQG